MRTARIGVIGDFDSARPTHVATNDAIARAAQALRATVDIEWVPTDAIASLGTDGLAELDGLWASPGSPYRSLEGMLEAIRFAREHGRPFVAT